MHVAAHAHARQRDHLGSAASIRRIPPSRERFADCVLAQGPEAPATRRDADVPAVPVVGSATVSRRRSLSSRTTASPYERSFRSRLASSAWLRWVTWGPQQGHRRCRLHSASRRPRWRATPSGSPCEHPSAPCVLRSLYRTGRCGGDTTSGPPVCTRIRRPDFPLRELPRGSHLPRTAAGKPRG